MHGHRAYEWAITWQQVHIRRFILLLIRLGLRPSLQKQMLHT